MAKQSIDITDEFTDPNGEFDGYAALNKAQEEGLRKQKHVDIRSFVPDQPAALVNMLFMDRLTMFYLDGESAPVWNSGKEYNPGEIVEKASIKYVSIKTGSNKEPPNAEYWKVAASTGQLSRYSYDAAPPAKVIVINNEGWTYGEVGPQSDRNNWNGIKVVCNASQITTTQSVITFNQ